MQNLIKCMRKHYNYVPYETSGCTIPILSFLLFGRHFLQVRLLIFTDLQL